MTSSRLCAVSLILLRFSCYYDRVSADNIVLIGMPGSGKSTVGVILAKLMRRDFVDTDVLVQTFSGRLLQEIVDTDGYMVLRSIEEEVILRLTCRNHVIATGGSAVYSSRAMGHLKTDSVVIFLHADLPTLASRIHDPQTRGLAKRQDQTLADLFAERLPLYRTYADIAVDCSRLSHEEVCTVIVDQLRG